MAIASVSADALPPQDIEMEARVLGSILLDPDEFDEVAALLVPDDFYRSFHADVFGAMRGLRAARQPIDALMVREWLNARDNDASLDEINHLISQTPYSNHAAHYAAHIKSHSMVREIIRISRDSVTRAYAGLESAEDQVQKAVTELLALAQSGTRSNIRDAEQMLQLVEAEISIRLAGKSMGIPSGFDELDDVTGGFGDGHLIVVAARPAMGKTAFAVQVAGELAIAQKRGVLFFSLEMSLRELMERLWSMRSGVLSERMQAPWHLDFGDEEKLAASRKLISPAPLWADDSFSKGVSSIVSASRSYAANRNLKCVVIDYLGLIRGEKSDGRMGANRQEQVAEISRTLKGLAKELSIPVIVLSQLNRELEKRPDKRPLMSDLRESGAIEQDADKVIFLHRPEYFNPEDKPGVAEAIVAKNRQGRIGTVDLRWISGLTRFESSSSALNTAEARAFDEPY